MESLGHSGEGWFEDESKKVSRNYENASFDHVDLTDPYSHGVSVVSANGMLVLSWEDETSGDRSDGVEWRGSGELGVVVEVIPWTVPVELTDSESDSPGVDIVRWAGI